MSRYLVPFPLDADKLRRIIRYEPKLGVFYWIARPVELFNSALDQAAWNGRYAESEAGYINRMGYRVIVFDKRPWPAHRIAWLHVTGEWPDRIIDHVNMIKDDNRWCNLRLSDESTNAFNRIVPKRLPRGVVLTHNKTNPYRARITVRNQIIYLGYFPTVEAADEAFKDAARRHFGEFCPP